MTWRSPGRITKVVHRRRWRVVFHEHTTSYVVHKALSFTLSVLTPSPYPHMTVLHVSDYNRVTHTHTCSPMSPHDHDLHFHFHSGSLVSATLPQRGLRLFRQNRCITIDVWYSTQSVRVLDILKLHLFILHNTDTIAFPLFCSHFLRYSKPKMCSSCLKQRLHIMC